MSFVPNHINTLRELFFRYGLKSMTMDEIARHLGCSKKTIYEHYSDKKILVHAVLGGYLNEHRNEMAALEHTAGNAIETFISMAAVGFQKMRNLTPTLLFDLQKGYPELWMELERYRREEIVKIYKRHIERGQVEGLFRPEIDSSIVSIMHLQHTNLLLDPVVFSHLDRPLVSIFRNIMEVFVCGIATTNGMEVWNKTKVQMNLSS
jgi:AcrR family transcriptional regulator